MGLIATYWIWYFIGGIILNAIDGIYRLASEKDTHHSWKMVVAMDFIVALVDMVIVFGYFLGW